MLASALRWKCETGYAASRSPLSVTTFKIISIKSCYLIHLLYNIPVYLISAMLYFQNYITLLIIFLGNQFEENFSFIKLCNMFNVVDKMVIDYRGPSKNIPSPADCETFKAGVFTSLLLFVNTATHLSIRYFRSCF